MLKNAARTIVNPTRGKDEVTMDSPDKTNNMRISNVSMFAWNLAICANIVRMFAAIVRNKSIVYDVSR